MGKQHKARASWTVWRMQPVFPDDPFVRAEVYSSNHAIPNHAAGTSRDRLLPGIASYKCIEEPIAPQELQSYPMITIDGEEVHEVGVKLIATIELTNIKFRLELVDPKFDQDKRESSVKHPCPRRADVHSDNDDRGLRKSKALGVVPTLLHDEDFPSAIQRNTGTRARDRPDLPGLPSPPSTTQREGAESDSETDVTSYRSSPSPPSKRLRSKAPKKTSDDRDGDYVSHSRPTEGPSMGMTTRSRRRREGEGSAGMMLNIQQ